MKGIFGFLTGAAIGAASLVGLRKVLNSVNGPDNLTEPAGNHPQTADFSYEVDAKSFNTTGDTGHTSSNEQPDLEAASQGSLTSSDPASLAGEPVERHLEPEAATRTEPDATTPRSETFEPAIVENPVMEPAPQTKPVKNATPGNVQANGSKKTTKTAGKPPSDDLTLILDIGPVFNQKLRAAGIKSFKALAQLTAAQVEEKTGIPAERVERGQWIEQAQKLSTQEPKV